MKNLIYIILSFLFLWSCQNEDLESIKDTKQEIMVFDSNISYPLSVTTRSSDALSTTWETLDQITLPSGESVYTPWNSNYSKNTIPADYSKDIKKADGWNLIAHTINGIERGLNYLLFYNKFTGMLKVFYYLEHSYSQTTGLWHVHIDKPQNLLAFTNNYAKPIESVNKTQEVYCSNITMNQDKAFAEGWNCFELELAYDPLFTTGSIYIEPCGIIQSNLEISGNYNSSSNGTIITMSSQKKGNLKGSGSDAKKHILDESSKVSKIYSDLSTLTTSSSISDFLKKGVAKLFKSFAALTKKQSPLEYKLQYTTNGTVTLSGSINTNLGGGFSPVKINISKNMVGNLGVWNLRQEPIIYFNTLGRLVKTSPTSFPTFRIYGAGKETYSVVINPDILKEVVSYSNSYEVFTSTFRDTETTGIPTSNGSISGGMNYSGMGASIYEDLHSKQAVEFKAYFPNIDNNGREVPGMIYLYNSVSEDNIPFGIYNNYAFKVSLSLNIDNNNESISTKTFVPELEWRKDNLNMNSQYAEYYDSFVLQKL